MPPNDGLTDLEARALLVERVVRTFDPTLSPERSADITSRLAEQVDDETLAWLVACSVRLEGRQQAITMMREWTDMALNVVTQTNEIANTLFGPNRPTPLTAIAGLTEEPAAPTPPPKPPRRARAKRASLPPPPPSWGRLRRR